MLFTLKWQQSVKKDEYFDHLEWRFNVISSIKTFKYFQDGYSFSRSPHVLFLNIAFSPSDQVQGEFDNLEFSKLLPFSNITVICPVCVYVYVYMYRYRYRYMYRYISVYPQNRRGILVKMVHEHGHYFLWHITESIWILEDVVASSYV